MRLRSFHWDVPDARGGVLLVHGFGDHTGRYHDVARVLGARGYSVLAYDQRGHGSSEGPRGHADRFDLYLADLDGAWAETARRLSGPCFLYAHSFGGLVAIRWLQTRSSRPAAVVLSAPWLGTALRVPGWKLLAAKLLLRALPALAIPSGPSQPELLTRDPTRMAAYREDPLVHRLISAGFHAEVGRARASARAAALPPGLPVLLLVPGDDGLVDAEATLRWARRWGSGMEVQLREWGRHELHNDLDREAALTGVADWLDARQAVEPVGKGRVSSPRPRAGARPGRDESEHGGSG